MLQCASIGQNMAEAYPELPIVPNMLPLKHHWFRPRPKPGDCVKISYSPSNTNRRGFEDKGAQRTIAALKTLEERGVEVEIMTNMPLCDVLERKGSAHIAIDECVTGGYHRASLEGLALGCVVVNDCRKANVERIKAMSGAPDHPFVISRIGDLLQTLEKLVALGPAKLEAMGRENRWWAEEYWNSKDLLERCWLPFCECAQ